MMSESIDQLGGAFHVPVPNPFQHTNELVQALPEPEYNPIQDIDVEPNWTGSRAGSILAKFCMFSDVMPINLGIYSVLEFTTHKNFLSLSSLALSTMVTKSSGAVASVDLLHTESLEQASKEFAHKHPIVNSFNLHKKDFHQDSADGNSFIRLARRLRQPAIDVAVSSMVGTSVMSGMRQVQSPEISRSSGRRRGIVMAGISTILTTAGVKYFGDHWKDPATYYDPIVGLATAGGLLGTWRVVKGLLTNWRAFKNPEQELDLDLE